MNKSVSPDFVQLTAVTDAFRLRFFLILIWNLS